MTEPASTETSTTSSATETAAPANGTANSTTTTTETTESVATRKDWQAEAEKWKTLARKHEGAAKLNAEKATEYDKAQESRKSEIEKLQDRNKAAEDRARAALSRAVKAEVRALATGEFADPSDAALYLGDLSQYVDEKSGDIDSAALESALKDIGKAKPHLLKAARTDVGVGARGGNQPKSMDDAIRALAGRR